MPDPHPRQAIVEALDDLGERDVLTYDQRTAADDPYPPSVVEERLAALRRRRWWLWVGLGVVMVGTIGASTSAVIGWSVFDFLVGMLPGVVAVTGIGVQQLVAVEKKVQLYVVLQRVDHADAGASASAEPA